MATYEKGSDVPGTTADDGTVAMNETDRLIASDKVEGSAVYTRAGESLGTVYNFMVDKYSGKVAYAVMSFGGFLGIGERYHALPWDKLDYDAGMGGYVVDIDRETLEGAPHYGRDESPWRDPNYGEMCTIITACPTIIDLGVKPSLRYQGWLCHSGIVFEAFKHHQIFEPALNGRGLVALLNEQSTLTTEFIKCDL